jgi:hypothetical protein
MQNSLFQQTEREGGKEGENGKFLPILLLSSIV